jgi:hypothetical protein
MFSFLSQNFLFQITRSTIQKFATHYDSIESPSLSINTPSFFKMKSLHCFLLTILLTLSLLSIATCSTTNNEEKDIPSHHDHRRYLRSVENNPTAAAELDHLDRDLLQYEKQQQQQEEENMMIQHLDLADDETLEDGRRQLYYRRYG